MSEVVAGTWYTMGVWIFGKLYKNHHERENFFGIYRPILHAVLLISDCPGIFVAITHVVLDRVNDIIG